MPSDRQFGGKDPIEFVQKNGRLCAVAPRDVVGLSETEGGCTWIGCYGGSGYHVQGTLSEVTERLRTKPAPPPGPVAPARQRGFDLMIAALAALVIALLAYSSCANEREAPASTGRNASPTPGRLTSGRSSLGPVATVSGGRVFFPERR